MDTWTLSTLNWMTGSHHSLLRQQGRGGMTTVLTPNGVCHIISVLFINQACQASSKPAVLSSRCVPNHLCFARIRSSVVKSASFLYVPRPKSFS